MNKIAHRITVTAVAEDLCNQLNANSLIGKFSVKGNALEADIGMNITYVKSMSSKQEAEIAKALDGKLYAEFAIQIINADSSAIPPQDETGPFKIFRLSNYFIDGKEVFSKTDNYDDRIFEDFGKASQMAKPKFHIKEYQEDIIQYLMDNDIIDEDYAISLRDRGEFIKDADK